MLEMDLNADLGEGLHPEADLELFALVTSANIACGGHAADPASMRESCRLAVSHGVAIGAHPSYEDRHSFGRSENGLVAGEIRELALRQVGALAEAAEAEGGRLSHVKAHGALYHRLGSDRAAAESFVAAVESISTDLLVVGAPGSALEEAAIAAGGSAFVAEGFADRGYLPDGSLVPRGQAGDLLDAEEAWHQVLQLLGAVDPLPGVPAGMVSTVCVHGDGDDAVAIAKAARSAFEHAGVRLAPPGSGR